MYQFYRSRLPSDLDKIYYSEIARQIRMGNYTGHYCLPVISGKSSSEEVFRAVQALRYDRPDYFFLSGQSDTVQNQNHIMLYNRVPYSEGQIRRIYRVLYQKIHAIRISWGSLPMRKREELVYEDVARSLTYKNQEEEIDHNIIGPLLKHTGVCEGYSCYLMILMRSLDIPVIRVMGYGNHEAHCWNMVWIEGKPYHLDVTWESVDRHTGKVGKRYYNLTTQEISQDHTILTTGLPGSSK